MHVYELANSLMQGVLWVDVLSHRLSRHIYALNKEGSNMPRLLYATFIPLPYRPMIWLHDTHTFRGERRKGATTKPR